MIELSKMIERKRKITDNINSIRSETETSVDGIRTRIAGVRDTLDNIIRVRKNKLEIFSLERNCVIQ